MEVGELFAACRLGKLERVKLLVEERDVELNVRDMWDSTPLYYACLCGHQQLVQYLLEHGARCEADTFDGERALYGALTEEIRRLLLHHKAITSHVIRRNQYEEFLRVLWESENDPYADIIFSIHGRNLALHRCILAARSAYFRQHFAGKWATRKVIRNRHPQVDNTAFSAIIQYMYTGRLEIHVDFVEDCRRLCKQFHLTYLDARLQRQQHDAKFFVMSKFGKPSRVRTLVIEPQAGASYHELHSDLGQLALHALPPQDFHYLPFDDDPDQWRHLADVIFAVQGQQFHCHKVFFCSRSAYFQALINDHFHESTRDESGSPVIVLHDISVAAFTAVVYYVYQDAAEISPEVVMELLFIAEMYLLPGLKKQCAAVIADNLECSNVVSLLRLARQLQLTRLEAATVEFIAKHLDAMIEQPELHEVIVEDAQLVKERQETDTIDVVDDIRFYITNNLHTSSQAQQEKLTLIERLLEKLGLEA